MVNAVNGPTMLTKITKALSLDNIFPSIKFLIKKAYPLSFAIMVYTGGRKFPLVLEVT